MGEAVEPEAWCAKCTLLTPELCVYCERRDGKPVAPQA